nr:V-type proton ATPase subunit d 2 isoform X1 [Manis javanica]
MQLFSFVNSPREAQPPSELGLRVEEKKSRTYVWDRSQRLWDFCLICTKYALYQLCIKRDVKIHLQTTDYGNFLANQTNPLTVSKIDTEMKKKLCREFEYFQNHSLEPLSTFFTYMTCSYMIDNVILLMNGALQKKSVKEILGKCHPLGRFTEMEAVNIAETPTDLFNAVLVETPLAPFFQDCMSENILDELNIELLRNKLYKSHLEAFYKFCKNHDDVTADIMCPILEFEADRRAFIITLNSFGTELSKEDRKTLYPTCGMLHPEGLRLLAQAEDFEQMKRVADHYGVCDYTRFPECLLFHCTSMYTSYQKQS